MKVRLLLTVGMAISATCSAPAEKVTVINHVTVIDVERGASRPDQAVVINGSLIKQVAPARQVDASLDTRILDGTGKYVIPGLWDMHVHVSGGDRALEMLLAAGITGARDMGGDFAKLADARRRIAAGQLNGPRLVLAGPMLRGPKSSTDTSDAESWVVRTPDEGRRAVESLSGLGVDFVKVHEDLSREAFLAIAESARGKGLPFAGHVPAPVEPVEASAAGEVSIEHLEWVPDPCLLLFNGNGARAKTAAHETCSQPAMDALAQELVHDGTWLDPTIGSFRYWAPDQWEGIFSEFRILSKSLRRSGVQLLAGTDWSTSLESRGGTPGGSLHDELALLVEAGFSPADVLRSATSNPARFLGLFHTLGSVEAGKTADLVLLDADPLNDIHNTRRVVSVIRGGQVFPTRGAPPAK